MSLVADIRKNFGSFTLSASFSLEAGVLAILGPSGSGKSMTLKCLAGIERPDEGRIELDGRILFDSSQKINLKPQKRQVGLLFQDYALFPTMTVLQNIMAGMKGEKTRARAEDYVNQFQLAGLENQLPNQLSGGQKQRVAMARMLAADPELILLDEPFSALDADLKTEVMAETGEWLRASGKKAIFVTHDRQEALKLCTAYIEMSDGCLGEMMPVSELAK